MIKCIIFFMDGILLEFSWVNSVFFIVIEENLRGYFLFLVVVIVRVYLLSFI